MARGGPRPGAGRPKGSPDRLTPIKKAMLKAFVDETYDLVRQDFLAISNPTDRVKVWVSLAEFAYPKLGRQELVGDGGAPIQVQIIKYGDGA